MDLFWERPQSSPCPLSPQAPISWGVTDVTVSNQETKVGTGWDMPTTAKGNFFLGSLPSNSCPPVQNPGQGCIVLQPTGISPWGFREDNTVCDLFPLEEPPGPQESTEAPEVLLLLSH